MAAALLWGAPAFAATLYFDAPSTVSAGDIFTLKVLIDSKDKGFNAAEAAITFPTNVLEVTSIDTTPASTAFNFWISLPSFSNDKGLVVFSGGATRGMVGPAIQVLAVHVRAKGVGDATIVASDASVNASDGSGANILDTINTKRITVRAAQATPAPEPSDEPEAPPAVQQPNTAPAATPAQSNTVCDEFFSRCDLPFPSITEVSVGPRQQTGVSITVSGTGVSGDNIRLRLNRDDTFYTRIYALVEPDGTWKATFNKIYAYGSYDIEASTEDPNGKLSQPAHWDNINIYPPFTFYVFGQPLRWYLLVEAAVVALSMATLLAIAIRYRSAKKRMRVLGRFLLGSIATVVLVSGAVYYFWYQEHKISTYWKDTTIPCINQNHSFIDKYISVPIQIYVDDKLLEIPAHLGIAPTCLAAVHTHDNSGNLHIEPSQAGVALAEFFALTGETLKRPGYMVAVYINGTEYTDQIENHPLRAGDSVIIRYTSSR
jgi:hypothetical protein